MIEHFCIRLSLVQLIEKVQNLTRDMSFPYLETCSTYFLDGCHALIEQVVTVLKELPWKILQTVKRSVSPINPLHHREHDGHDEHGGL